MKITTVGRKCTLRDSFKERAEKKLAKIERFFGEDAEAKVTATVEKTSQSVEITVMYNGMIFRAEEKAPNMNDALDSCVDSLVRQIRKNKTRVEKRLRTGDFDSIVAPAEKVEEEVDYEIVRSKTVDLKPQSVEEAILQMNLLGHQFYLFLNVETDSVCAVYHRKDGGYGVLVPNFDGTLVKRNSRVERRTKSNA